MSGQPSCSNAGRDTVGNLSCAQDVSVMRILLNASARWRAGHHRYVADGGSRHVFDGLRRTCSVQPASEMPSYNRLCGSLSPANLDNPGGVDRKSDGYQAEASLQQPRGVAIKKRSLERRRRPHTDPRAPANQAPTRTETIREMNLPVAINPSDDRPPCRAV